MPVYKAVILNKEVSLNYEVNQKDQLIEAVKAINSKLQEYNYHNGKISDSKLLSLLAIKLQAEILDLKKRKSNESNLERKYEESNAQNINLNDTIYQLRKKNNLLQEENKKIYEELLNIQNQIDTIIKLIKKIYEE